MQGRVIRITLLRGNIPKEALNPATLVIIQGSSAIHLETVMVGHILGQMALIIIIMEVGAIMIVEIRIGTLIGISMAEMGMCSHKELRRGS